MRSKGSEEQADVGGLLATQDHGDIGAQVDVKGLDAGRVILIWVTCAVPEATATSGPQLLPRPVSESMVLL